MNHLPEPVGGAAKMECPTSPIAIAVLNESGEIRIARGERDGVALSWTKHPDPEIPDWEEWSLSVEQSAAALVVEVTPPQADLLEIGGDLWSLKASVAGRAPSFTIEIAIGRTCRVSRCEASLGAGAIDISGLKARSITASGAAADVSVTGCAGAISTETASGSIRLAACDGEIRARTVAGSIRADACAGAIQLSSASGPVQVAAGPAAAGSVDIETVAGAIRIDADPGASGTLQVGAAAGRPAISPEFRPGPPGTWTIGSGAGVAISARTSVGRVSAAVSPPAAPSSGTQASR